MRRAAHASAALLLLLAASSLAAAQSQTQSGLLYWCSTVEGGANFNTVPGTPRSFWGVNLNPWMANGACHAGGALSNNAQYTFNNGTAYPTNRNPAVNNFAISPTQCQVGGGKREQCRYRSCALPHITTYPIPVDPHLTRNMPPPFPLIADC